MKKLTVLLALVLSVLLPALAVAEEAEPTRARWTARAKRWSSTALPTANTSSTPTPSPSP